MIKNDFYHIHVNGLEFLKNNMKEECYTITEEQPKEFINPVIVVRLNDKPIIVYNYLKEEMHAANQYIDVNLYMSKLMSYYYNLYSLTELYGMHCVDEEKTVIYYKGYGQVFDDFVNDNEIQTTVLI